MSLALLAHCLRRLAYLGVCAAVGAGDPSAPIEVRRRLKMDR